MTARPRWWQRGPLLAGCSLFAALAVIAVAPRAARADDADAATALIDRSRVAAARHDFAGTMVVEWRVGGQLRQRDVAVAEHDGVLRLGDDRVVGAGARRLLKSNGGWRLLWSGTPSGAEPDPSAKYVFRVASGPAVAGRPATQVAITRVGADRAQERMYFDRTTDLLLRRDQFDDAGRLARRVGFVAISAPTPASSTTRDTLPTVAGDTAAPRPVRHVPDDMTAHRRIGEGFVLLGTYRGTDGGAQLYYSDGLFGLSLFERSGDLAWDDLPGGGRSIELGGGDARMYPTPAGSAVVWEHDGVTYTCVTDAPLGEVRAVAADLDRWHSTSTLEDVGRFVTGPFNWG